MLKPQHDGKAKISYFNNWSYDETDNTRQMTCKPE